MSRIPAAFGPFEPLRRLGAGGMAETFVALRRGPGRFEQTVCIKRILPAYEGDAEFVAAFLDEARTSAALRHANIVQVLDFGVADGSHYLALELIDGVDLRTLLRPVASAAHVALPADLVTLIALDLAQALAHAHGPDSLQPAVAHRDISPSNVLVSKAGEIKLTDFGIARAAHHTRRTRTGVLKGKVPYMPPEYVEDSVFDARSDLFSLGVLLYELLVGVRPFDGATDIETARRITTGQHRSLLDSAPPAEHALRTCIERLLSTNPNARFQSAMALADALPEVSTHHVRGRLASRVAAASSPRPSGASSGPRTAKDELRTAYAATRADARSGAATVPLSVLPKRAGTEKLTPAGAVRARGSERTRTIARQPRRSPWLFVALAVGALAATALLWAGARAAEARNQRVAQVPALPVRPTDAAPAGALLPTAASPHAGPSEAGAVHAGAMNAGASPSGASPSGASPSGASPSGASPSGASPSGASPSGASPSGAAPTADAPAPARRITRLRVVVVPYGDVWIDGERVGSAPITVRVGEGSHLVAVGPGRIDASLEILASKAEQRVTFRRRPNGTFRHQQ